MTGDAVYLIGHTAIHLTNPAVNAVKLPVNALIGAVGGIQHHQRCQHIGPFLPGLRGRQGGDVPRRDLLHHFQLGVRQFAAVRGRGRLRRFFHT